MYICFLQIKNVAYPIYVVVRKQNHSDQSATRSQNFNHQAK